MRYFVTVDSQEFSLALPAARDAHGMALQPAGAGAAPLQVELLCRPGTDRAAVVLVDGHVFRVRKQAGRAGAVAEARVNGRLVQLSIESELERRSRPARSKAAASGARVCAPMPGRVVKVAVRAGDIVTAGAGLLSIEAMKMENELQAPCEGRVVRVAVEAGATVEADQELLVIEPVA